MALNITISNNGVLSMSTYIKASPEAIFSFITDPEMVPKWMGPENVTIEVIEMNVEVGGSWRNKVTENTRIYFMSGVYTKLEKPNLIEYTQIMGSNKFETTTKIEIAKEGDGSRVTVEVTTDGQGEVLDFINTDQIKEGYNDSWKRLIKLVEKK